MICKPFKQRSDYIFEALNETTLLTISYFLIIYIQIVDDSELRYEIGWYIIAVTLFSILVNWLNLVATAVITLIAKIKLKLKQRKQAK